MSQVKKKVKKNFFSRSCFSVHWKKMKFWERKKICNKKKTKTKNKSKSRRCLSFSKKIFSSCENQIQNEARTKCKPARGKTTPCKVGKTSPYKIERDAGTWQEFLTEMQHGHQKKQRAVSLRLSIYNDARCSGWFDIQDFSCYAERCRGCFDSRAFTC